MDGARGGDGVSPDVGLVPAAVVAGCARARRDRRVPGRRRAARVRRGSRQRAEGAAARAEVDGARRVRHPRGVPVRVRGGVVLVGVVRAGRDGRSGGARGEHRVHAGGVSFGHGGAASGVAVVSVPMDVPDARGGLRGVHRAGGNRGRVRRLRGGHRRALRVLPDHADVFRALRRAGARPRPCSRTVWDGSSCTWAICWAW